MFSADDLSTLRERSADRLPFINNRPLMTEGGSRYAIADQQGWLVGETLEHALAALQRELEGQGA